MGMRYLITFAISLPFEADQHDRHRAAPPRHLSEIPRASRPAVRIVHA